MTEIDLFEDYNSEDYGDEDQNDMMAEINHYHGEPVEQTDEIKKLPNDIDCINEAIDVAKDALTATEKELLNAIDKNN